MVNWTAEKDRTILKGIFKFHNIKNSQPFLEFLANEIGEGCTLKAVSNRLTNLRKSGKPVNSGSAASTPIKKSATPRTPRTPASGRGRSKAIPSKKFDNDDTTSDGEEEEPIVSPSIGRKRGRASACPQSYHESDATTGDEDEDFAPMNKKIKAELVEEEGVADTAGTDGPLEDEDEDVAFV
ncbi:uncharacterized protein M421DRAFT_395756 [Didymella exigua CBS 183.55]|uniref:Uncharacterized protein n=1 Tax=Didymella exigua CBS 183.55 TaxID=1150837 RepID=A0A6A5S7Z2_9PLEO|nr:uncharacterized protein M421DRAFT_395756 [Didymella exigua CBS 183.55]KAF1933637.1 hypothetical protein M421DRAFT_395756 [Didymella exigua CBS 183.55]